jgi:hypothetical protein
VSLKIKIHFSMKAFMFGRAQERDELAGHGLHWHHFACLKQWLQIQGCCPVCKVELRKPVFVVAQL